VTKKTSEESKNEDGNDDESPCWDPLRDTQIWKTETHPLDKLAVMTV
jgi:hypothetical protein